MSLLPSIHHIMIQSGEYNYCVIYHYYQVDYPLTVISSVYLFVYVCYMCFNLNEFEVVLYYILWLLKHHN